MNHLRQPAIRQYIEPPALLNFVVNETSQLYSIFFSLHFNLKTEFGSDSLFLISDYPQCTRGHTVSHHRFAILLRYCRSAYVQYASFQCLTEAQICGAKLLRTPSTIFGWLTRQRNEAYWTYAD